MTTLTDAQAEAAEQRMVGRNRPLPTDPVARFDARITAVMAVTGKGRSWARVRAAERWPQEAAAADAARSA